MSARKSKAPKGCDARAKWFLIGAGSVVGTLWIVARLWREAWGISNAPATPALPTERSET